jgi:nitrate/TMAO reductase-like tetraheme cytochrome c subunit
VAGWIRRLWSTLRGKLRGLWGTLRGKLLILGVSASILLVGGTFVGLKATEGNRFCGYACHEMLPYAHTWEASKHANVNCVKCHIPPGPWNLAKTKFFALRELYVHFLATVPQPITVTRRIANPICTGCHPSSQLAAPVHLITADFSHSAGHAKVPLCVDCHAQVVHNAIPGATYTPPQSMASCFSCHDGKQQPNACTYCHTTAPPHPLFGPCETCHNLDSWVPGNFKHPVPLTGPHSAIACETCHTKPSSTSIGLADGCVNCHGDHHNDPRLTACATCHTTTHFVPSTFAHPQEGPHVPAGDEPIPCAACHTKTFATATCSCHGGKPPTGGG